MVQLSGLGIICAARKQQDFSYYFQRIADTVFMATIVDCLCQLIVKACINTPLFIDILQNCFGLNFHF